MSKFNILCGRAAMIGDTVSALPIASYYKRKYPDANIIWPIAKKCSQAAPIFLNHPDIDQVIIFDGQEGPESERDWNLVSSCKIVINPNPPHPDNLYPAEFSIYSETWRMAGLPMSEWDSLTPEQRRPKLVKWWNEEKPESFGKKIISYWPCAGYGVENKRNASKEWCQDLTNALIKEGYCVHQYGTPRDYSFDILEDYQNFRSFKQLSFLEQIKQSLTSDLMIGTDSGSALVTAAYQTQLQISLLTNHWPGIERNKTALASDSPKNFNFFGLDSADRIEIKEVVEKIKELTYG